MNTSYYIPVYLYHIENREIYILYLMMNILQYILGLKRINNLVLIYNVVQKRTRC